MVQFSLISHHVVVDTEHQVSRAPRLVPVAWTVFYFGDFCIPIKPKIGVDGCERDPLPTR